MPTPSTVAATSDEIRQFVIENFLFGEGQKLRDEESFLDKGLIDSTGVLELIAFIETRYGIQVEDEETIPQNLDGVTSIANYVCRKLGNGSPAGPEA